jgi:hypothetical protein
MLYVIENIPIGTMKLPEPEVYVKDPAGVLAPPRTLNIIPLTIRFQT